MWVPGFGEIQVWNQLREKGAEVDGQAWGQGGCLPPTPHVNPFTHLHRLTDRPLTWQKVVQSALLLVLSWLLKDKRSRTELHVPSAFLGSSCSQAWLCLTITW